jgi:hypothetical protein
VKGTPAHIFAAAERVTRWPRSIQAICGAEVERPDAVLDFDVEEYSLQTPRMTTKICNDCFGLLKQPVSGVKYFYGVLPQEEAHRANLRTRMED